MPDAEQIRVAESRFHFTINEDKTELARNIPDKARKFGVYVVIENGLNRVKK